MAEEDVRGDGGFAEKIKEFLFDGPASINDVCNDLKISWATAKSTLEKMKEEGTVKEIISNPKIRIFKLTNDPAFYGVPLTKQQKNDALFLFQTIRQEWQRSKEEPLLLTTLQKIAVDIATKCNCNIPHAQFHYGQVVPIFETPTPLFEIIQPINYTTILNCVKEEVHKHQNDTTREMDDQYEKYSMILYQAKQRFKKIYQKARDNKELKEVEPALIGLLMNWPIQNQDPEMFSLFSEFVKEVHGLIITKTANENIEKINETFDLLWDLITTDLFFKDLERQIVKPKKEIFEYIRSNQILSKKQNAEERTNYLKLFIDTTIEIEMPMDEDSLEIRRILTEGVEEE
jgi:DNA-binding Lrp family transcriptional regulator